MKFTLHTIENMDAKAREDIANTERMSQTAEPSIRRSIGSLKSGNEPEKPLDETVVQQEDVASQPDYVESARGSARLIDSNLEEIRRGSVDLGS